MEALKIKKHIDSEILNLPVPKTMVGKDIEIILLVESDDLQQKSTKAKREPGSAKGMMTMTDDFEKPLDDEYSSAQSKEALQKVRERVRRYVAPGRSLVEELIQDRRKESVNEFVELKRFQIAKRGEQVRENYQKGNVLHGSVNDLMKVLSDD